MFWKRKSMEDQKGPINVPGFVGGKVVEIMQKRQDLSDHWVKYKGLVRPRAGADGSFDIRIFDQWDTDQKGIKVTDYDYLDAHPELVQFEGWFNPKTKKVEMRDTRKVESPSSKS
jgi:hypothetical protein